MILQTPAGLWLLRILISPASMSALPTWARGVCCFHYHVGYLENLEKTDREKGSFMLVSWWCDDAKLFLQTWIFLFLHIFCLFVGTRVTSQQQNEQSYKDFVFLSGTESERRKSWGFQGNLIVVIQSLYKEPVLPLLSENGGALMCLCESSLCSKLWWQPEFKINKIKISKISFFIQEIILLCLQVWRVVLIH